MCVSYDVTGRVLERGEQEGGYGRRHPRDQLLGETDGSGVHQSCRDGRYHGLQREREVRERIASRSARMESLRYTVGLRAVRLRPASPCPSRVRSTELTLQSNYRESILLQLQLC